MTRAETLGNTHEEQGSSIPLLETLALKRYYSIRSPLLKRHVGWVKAVDEVSLTIAQGETFGLVGESGCGKSTFGKTVAGIYTPTSGEVRYKGAHISQLRTRRRREFQRNVQYLHQNPALCLDPWWRVGRSVQEPLRIHERHLSKLEARKRVAEILDAVGLDPHSMARYPHEFSGGQQRRIGLARLLVLRPDLIIFDEPTSGLDVSVQATILRLIEHLKQDFHLTYVHISHNLAVVDAVCGRIGVMYLGRIVEIGDAARIMASPMHPYTKMLFAAVPQISETTQGGRSAMILGEPPDPQSPPPGCRFHTRCAHRQQSCDELDPLLQEVSPGHFVACPFAGEEWVPC